MSILDRVGKVRETLGISKIFEGPCGDMTTIGVILLSPGQAQEAVVHTARVSAQGRLVIPKPLRERYGIEPGSLIQFVDYAGALLLVPQREDAVEADYGALRRPGEACSWTRAYLEDKRTERDMEEQRPERHLRLWCSCASGVSMC